MNLMTWYGRSWVNRRSRRALHSRNIEKYFYHYRTSWIRFKAHYTQSAISEQYTAMFNADPEPEQLEGWNCRAGFAPS